MQPVIVNEMSQQSRQSGTVVLCGPAVEHRSLAGVLSLSCARLVADG